MIRPKIVLVQTVLSVCLSGGRVSHVERMKLKFKLPQFSAEQSPEVAARQQRRSAELKRFNRIYLYTPLIIVAVLSLMAVGVLAWATLFANGTIERQYSSGIADFFALVTCLIPFTIIFAILPIGMVALLYFRYKRGSVARQYLVKGATFVETGLHSADSHAQTLQHQLAKKTIESRGRFAYYWAIVDQFRQKIKDSAESFLNKE